MKNRISLLLIACLFLLALVPGASAQGTDCLNLPEADCAVIQAAEANSDNVNSFLMGFVVDLNIAGLESFEPSAAGGVQFHVDGQGPFVGLMEPDPSALMGGNFAALFDAFNMQLDMNLSVVAPDENESAAFSIVIVDGTVYFQDPDSGQWIGMTGETLAAQMSQFGSMMGGMDPGSMGDPSAMMGQIPPELMTALSTVDFEGLAATPGFLNYERLADEQLMGQAMSPFRFTADFGTLFKSPEFQTSLTQVIQAASQMSAGDDPQAAQQAQMAAMMVPMVVGSTTGTFRITQWVGSTDQFIHKVAIDLNGAVDLSALMGSSGDAANTGPITVDFHFEITMDQINSTFDIKAPEGAMLLTEDMMSGS